MEARKEDGIDKDGTIQMDSVYTHNPQKTWTDKGREKPEKMRYKGVR